MSEALHHTVLLEAETNTDLGEWSLESESGPRWKMCQTLLHGGKQEGSKLLTIETDRLTMKLVPTRNMGIQSVTAGDLTLGWESPIKEIVHPSFMNLESRDGLGWLEGFNGWMCRCGLEWSGHPGMDTVVDNTGTKQEMKLSLHGKIANIPVSFAEVRVEKNGDATDIVIRSRTSERVFHGPKFELVSEIRLTVGTTRFSMRDTLTNCGKIPQEYQLLYHCNFGAPLLEKGARFVGNILENTPFNDRAKEGLKTFDVYEEPTPGFVEQVYKMKLKPNADGQAEVMLQNAAADRGASLRFNTSELPYFTLWKNTAAKEDGYVTGLEPGTCFPHNRKREREEGRVEKLQPGEERSFGLDVELHLSRDAVSEKKGDIEQSGH